MILLLSLLLPSLLVSAAASAYNSVTVGGGGFITGFVAHPTKKDLIYARTDIGGTYKYNKGKWEPILDFVLNNGLAGNGTNLIGTESIALDPTDPNRLYLAQGQYVQWDPWSAFFVSEDRGKTFKQYRSPVKMGANDMGRNGGERLVVNPFSPNELWFGSRTDGLWKSIDRAKTWTNVTSFPNAYANGIGLISLVFDPNVKGTAYVGACAPGGLYVTRDGGATWAPLAGQPKTWSPWIQSIVSGTGTAVQSTGPQPIKVALNNNRLYVTYADAPGPWGVLYGEVWSYDIATKTWAHITPSRAGANTYPAPLGLTTKTPGGWNGITFGKGNTVAVSTIDAYGVDSVYLSRDGGNSWKDLGLLSSPSTTSGGTWHQLSEAKSKTGVPVPWLAFDNPNNGLISFGWWLAAILIDPFNPERLWYGTGAGIWTTENLSRADANKSPTWYVNAEGIEETAVWVLKSPPTGPANLFSGMYDVGGMRHDDFSVPQPMYNSPTFSSTDGLDFAGQSANILARVGRNDLKATDSAFGCAQGAYTSNYGDAWTLFPTCPPDLVDGNGGSIAVGADGKRFVWTTQSGHYTSADGKAWAATGISGAVAADRVQANTFYAYNNGAVYVSTDGKKFSASGSLPAGTGTPVTSYLRAGELWVVIQYVGVYHSTDFGRTFTSLNVLNPTLFAVGAPKKKNGAETLFLWGIPSAGQPEGLYMFTSSSTKWERINDDQHQYSGATVLSGDPRVYGRAYFGTNGRGIISVQAKSASRRRAHHH